MTAKLPAADAAPEGWGRLRWCSDCQNCRDGDHPHRPPQASREHPEGWAEGMPANLRDAPTPLRKPMMVERPTGKRGRAEQWAVDDGLGMFGFRPPDWAATTASPAEAIAHAAAEIAAGRPAPIEAPAEPPAPPLAVVAEPDEGRGQQPSSATASGGRSPRGGRRGRPASRNIPSGGGRHPVAVVAEPEGNEEPPPPATGGGNNREGRAENPAATAQPAAEPSEAAPAVAAPAVAEPAEEGSTEPAETAAPQDGGEPDGQPPPPPAEGGEDWEDATPGWEAPDEPTGQTTGRLDRRGWSPPPLPTPPRRPNFRVLDPRQPAPSGCETITRQAIRQTAGTEHIDELAAMVAANIPEGMAAMGILRTGWTPGGFSAGASARITAYRRRIKNQAATAEPTEPANPAAVAVAGANTAADGGEGGINREDRPGRPPPAAAATGGWPHRTPAYIRAVANHTGLPATAEAAQWMAALRMEAEYRGRAVAFRFQRDDGGEDDKHIRRITRRRNGDTLGDWAGWNTGAAGQRLWIIPQPEGMAAVRNVLMTEGETGAIAAGWMLRHHPQWMVAATTGANYEPTTERDQQRAARIIAEGWPVVIWEDPDPGGRKMAEAIRTGMFGDHPTAIFQHGGDARWWQAATALRHGHQDLGDQLAELLETAAETAQPANTENETQAQAAAVAVAGANTAADGGEGGINREGGGRRGRPPSAGRYPADRPEYRREDALRRGYIPELAELLQRAGARPAQRRRNQWHCPQPFHRRGDQNPSLSATPQPDGNDLYKCWGCGWAGDRTGLAAEQAHQTLPEFLAEIFERMRTDDGWQPPPRRWPNEPEAEAGEEQYGTGSGGGGGAGGYATRSRSGGGGRFGWLRRQLENGDGEGETR